MKKQTSLHILLIAMTILVNCGWNRYIAYSPRNIPASKIAILYSPDDNLHIVDIDGRAINEFGWHDKTLNRCIIEFLPGAHHLTLLCYRRKPDLLGNGNRAHRIVKKQPEFQAGRIYRINAENRGGNLDARITDVTHIPKYQRVVRTDKSRRLMMDENTALRLRADAYAIQGRYNLAVVDLTRIIERDAGDVAAWRQRGAAYLTTRLYENAIHDFQETLILDPESVDGYIGLGRVLAAVNRIEEAVENLNKAAALAPDRPEIYIYRARVYHAVGEMAREKADLQKACALGICRDDYIEHQIERAKIVAGEQGEMQAEQILRNVRMLFPDDHRLRSTQ